MKDDTQSPLSQSEDRAARLTAYALGQLDDGERMRVEAELGAIPAARQECDELGRLAAALREARDEVPPPEPSGALRDRIAERLAEPVTRPPARPLKKPGRRSVWVALGVAAALAVCWLMILIPVMRTNEQVENVVHDWLPSSEEGFGNAPADYFSYRSAAERGQRAAELQQEAVARARRAEAEQARLSGEAERAQLAVEAEEAELRKRLLRAEAAKASASAKPLVITDPQDKNWVVPRPGTGAPIVSLSADGRSQAVPPTNHFAGSGWEGVAGPGGSDVSKEAAGMMGGMPPAGGEAATPYSADMYGGWSRDSGGYGAGLGEGFPAGSTPSPESWHYDMGSYGGMMPGYGEMMSDTPTPAQGRSGHRRRGKVHYYFTPPQQPASPTVAHNEQYEALAENEFLGVTDQPLSTFSIDVDTASYANVRRFLVQGQLPPPAAVRIEEMINYFSYHDAPPANDDPFAVAMELAECPWAPGHQLLRIGLQGKQIASAERPPCNLVFLLDVSGSMADGNKLPLLKQAMKLLVDQLTENDRVAIVTYANQAGVQLDSTSGHQHQVLRAAIDSLSASGSTNGSDGIQLAYQKAEQNFRKDGVNRVLLATDGDLNVGITQDDALVALIKEKARSGVFLTVLGFGEGNLKDAKLEKLADNGNGAYAYVDNLREARRVLVEQISSSLVTIAKDVKIKVEFNPAEVQAYRLIGYENRLMTPPEFNDDRKDAGEIGAGHSLTVLYELVLSDAPRSVAQLAQSLKYQRPAGPVALPAELTEAAASGELLTLSLRYKPPDGNESTLREYALKNERRAFSTASQDFRFAASVASFGMLLRGSAYRGNATFAAVEEIAAAAIGSDPQGHRTEFLDLVRRAGQM